MSSVLEVVKRCWGARTKKAAQVLGGVFAVLFLCLPAYSQGSFGRILGTITDQSGGVISGATVTVVDTERGVTRTLTTDDAGAYNAPSLTAGSYTVRAESKGFKRIERQGVVIEVGHEVRVDLTLQPGEQNQTVTVTEAVPLVETTNATMGGTLENADIIDLPLNGRDYQNLLGLRPGVMLQPGGGPWTQSTNGVRPDESVWLVEGVINENFFDARPVINMPSPFTDGATILPVDAIQEFNLMENPKAEYGWKAGAQVNVGIKSGTNTLHGDAYAFGRYQDWDARNYFNISNPAGCSAALLQPDGTCPKTAAQLKQFGGVVGGPIKKDKLFFFGGYEGLRSFIGFVGGIGLPATAAQAAPTTPNCPAGVIGNCATSMVNAIEALEALGTPRSKVSENLTGCTEPTATTATCTGGLLPNTGTSNTYLSTFPTTNISDNGVGKLDYHMNDKNTINGMFFYGNYTAPGEDHPFTNQAFTDNAPITSMSITSSWVYTPSSTVVNEARFGEDRVTFDFVNIDVNTPASTYGLPTGVTDPLAGGMPSIRIAPYGQGGTQVFGTAINRPQYFTPNPYWDVQDSLSVLKGKHSVKVGGEFAHMEADSKVYNAGRGLFEFPSLEAFYAGNATDGKLLTGSPLSKLTDMMFAGYVQDDWRISPKVIINLGIRYMYLSPLKDASNLFGNFDPSSPTGLVQQGQAGWNTTFKPDPHDFEPRFGMAWDLNGNGTTVVRLGVGLFHEVWNMETFEGQFQMQNNNATSPSSTPTGATIQCGLATNHCPASGGGTIALGSAVYPGNTLCWNASVAACAGQTTVFPTSGAGVSCGDGVNGAPSPCDLMAMDPNLKLPFVVNYNLGLTHAFGPNLSLEVEYVGNHGYRLLNFADINQGTLNSAYCLNTLTPAQKADACGPNRTVGFNTGTPGTPCVLGLGYGLTGACQANGQAVQETRPYYSKFPYIGFINYITNRSYSNYNSLQVTLTKRMTHGLLFNVGYTYGHGLDAGSLNRFGLNPQNSVNPANGEYANSDFDVRHRLTATATYNIPGVKGFGQILEGWQLNTVVTFATSQPWQTFDNADNFSGTNENADRWDIFGNPADFPSGKNSIPYCTAAGCTYNSIYGTFPILSAAAYQKCVAVAPDPNTLAAGGCYVSTNGNSVIVPPAQGTFGNMGRNVLRDNGFKDWDMSIFKNFTFKERYGIQARWEVFNVLNHPIAANPYGASSAVQTGNNPIAGGGGFGASLLTPDFAAGNPLIGSGSERVMQVGLKLTF
jgi:hypothetical protein